MFKALRKSIYVALASAAVIMTGCQDRQMEIVEIAGITHLKTNDDLVPVAFDIDGARYILSRESKHPTLLSPYGTILTRDPYAADIGFRCIERHNPSHYQRTCVYRDGGIEVRVYSRQWNEDVLTRKESGRATEERFSQEVARYLRDRLLFTQVKRDCY